jgi:DNA sulfur modification protein DndC
MTPLLELRNELDRPDDKGRRDFRRMSGRVQLMADGSTVIPGPYTKEWREHWLRRVLEAQQSARQEGPAEFRQLQLITLEQLHEVRRIWLYEKHEFDDSLPRIYQEATGEPFPLPAEEGHGLRADDWELLRELCGTDRAFFNLRVSLLGLEQHYRGRSRRARIYEELEQRLQTGLYANAEEAVAALGQRLRQREQARPVGLFAQELPVMDASAPDKDAGE